MTWYFPDGNVTWHLVKVPKSRRRRRAHGRYLFVLLYDLREAPS